jgi:hypothetical protein
MSSLNLTWEPISLSDDILKIQLKFNDAKQISVL